MSEATGSVDPRELRTVLGCYPTGVTVVTAPDGRGGWVGITANSFTSVSLEPPLVLWSLAESALSLPAFLAAGYFAVNVLAADQQELSDRFARRGEEKFAGVPVTPGVGGVALFPGCAARLQCRTWAVYEGGDHRIFVGEVLAMDRSDRPPLVFHRGRYCETRERPVAS